MKHYTDTPENVTQTSATLNGTLNPNGAITSYYFEYGTSTSYGKNTSTQSGGSGNNNISVSAPINNLQDNNIYHYRLIAQICNGDKIYGEDVQFTTLPPPSLNLTSPIGGENWIVGNQYPITWTSVSINNLKIELSTDSGNNWIPIINSIQASNGNYLWTVPNTISEKCKIKISDVSNASILDISDNNFTISEAPSILVIKPNGGEKWKIDSTYSIEWNSVNISEIKIEYSLTNGSSWSVIEEKYPSTWVYEWTINTLASSQCKIKISNANNTSLYDISDGLFSINNLTDVEFYNENQKKYYLYQNYPNPFNPITTINYSIPENSFVSLKIFNSLGIEVAKLIEEQKQVGDYSIKIDATNYPSGIYFYTLQTDNFFSTKKMIFLK
jgi:hypothetical protein